MFHANKRLAHISNTFHSHRAAAGGHGPQLYLPLCVFRILLHLFCRKISQAGMPGRVKSHNDIVAAEAGQWCGPAQLPSSNSRPCRFAVAETNQCHRTSWQFSVAVVLRRELDYSSHEDNSQMQKRKHGAKISLSPGYSDPWNIGAPSKVLRFDITSSIATAKGSSGP